MTDLLAGLKVVEIVLLAAVVLAFVVHPAMFILAGLRAVVLSAVKPMRVQTVKAAKSSPSPA
jgi:hypothetical protein